MAILLFHHEASLRHDTGPGHPERPDRIDAVLAGARRSGLVEERQAPEASPRDLAGVHTAAYVDAIEEFCASGGGHLDADTVAGPATWEAALRSVGAGLAAVDALRGGEAEAALLAMRPPGHHALRDRAMGFCLFNNVAVAADRIAAAGDRVAILDWDVHHGNGTQDIFYERGDVLYVSLHQFPFYPLTGWIEEVGGGGGLGLTVNLPLPEGAGGLAYAAAFDRVVDPVLAAFAPDWVLVSAGYDAHAADPLGSMALQADDFGWMAGRLAAPGRPVVAFLEGGYDLTALGDSVETTLRGLDGGAFSPSGGRPSDIAVHMLDEAARAAARHWPEVVQ
jgi:acetoin utilization deacetylase AcuC-like enzyme